MAGQDVNLDDAIQAFLAKGGKVHEVETYTYVPHPPYADVQPPKPPERPHRRRRGRPVGSTGPRLPRDADGLTEASRKKAEAAKTAVKQMLDEGLTITDIRRELGVSWPIARTAAKELGARMKVHSRPIISDEDAALALLLYMELTGISPASAARSLRLGHHRAERVLEEYPVLHPPIVLT